MSALKKLSDRYGEWLFLLLPIVALMVLNVPAQWTGIATDPEFSGWVAPLSNRLAEGLRLYDFGGHMPVPPLAPVFIYWLSWGHATWLTESFWNQVFSMGTILVLYGCLNKIFPRRVALLGAMAALATFSGCNVVLVYNTMANFSAACLGCFAVGYINRAPGKRGWTWLAGMAFFGVTAILSKQSIGILAIPAAAAITLLDPAAGSLKEKMVNVALYLGFTVAAFSLLSLLMSPWISIGGMMQDVFITGSECKGGIQEIIAKLSSYGFQIGQVVILTAFILPLTRLKLFSTLMINAHPWLDEKDFPLSWILAILATGLAGGILLARLQIDILPNLHQTETIGLAISLLAVLALLGKQGPRGWLPEFLRNKELLALGTLTFILLPAAMGYCLSGPVGFRTLLWFVHTLPFLQVALTAIVSLVFAGAKVMPKNLSKYWVVLMMIIFIAQNWQPWRLHWVEIKNCTDTWDNVKWYAGARITTTARPLETMVSKVRSLAGVTDTVLLLPSDPSVEACFERPRPALNCAIMFCDQYWPRYIDDDIKRLKDSPPKVIIIGPRNDWRAYSRLRNNSGALEMLIDRVQSELLPTRYRLADAHPIGLRGAADFMDVWVRVD